MEGWAFSLTKVYPQAKSTTDMSRACFYAGLRLLDYFAKNENADPKLTHRRTQNIIIEKEMGDINSIEETKGQIELFREKYMKDVITFKQYKAKRDSLLDSLKPSIETDIGNEVLKELTRKILKLDEDKENDKVFKRSDW